MISAGFEHGGNVTHRHLDGHPNLLVYPFESQLGNREFTDFLVSIERVQYRYPEFPEGLTADELYESMIDEELKTYLRKKNGSKFRDVDLVMKEEKRRSIFKSFLDIPNPSRARVVEAFFKSTFEAWENLSGEIKDDSIYVGYSPSIGIDAPRLIRDFPEIKIMHIIRNPFSAYFDTKRRPFPQPLLKYLITWNIYHSTANIYANLYPKNMRVFRYEDLVHDKESFMNSVCTFLDIPFNSALLYPSWNGKELTGEIAPWGTVLRSTDEYNKAIIDKLSTEEKQIISVSTRAIAKQFEYDTLSYLERYYC
jgi:hypothetical protein